MEPQPDAELIGRILGGERELYARLVTRYQETMFRHAAAMVGDHDAAADLVQDSFVKAFTRLDTCDPERFAAWLFRILRNRCKDWLKNRRQHTAPLQDDAHAAGEGDDPGVALERTELGRVVETALLRLPPAQREAFLLKHVEEMEYEQMSMVTGAGVSALKMRVKRACERMRRMLTEGEDAPTR